MTWHRRTGQNLEVWGGSVRPAGRIRVGESAESVVRRFLAAWTDPRSEELAGFFNEDAIWVDGPQGVRRGAKTIVDELVSQLTVSRGMVIEVDTLIAAGGTVMVEWHGQWSMRGKPVLAKVMAAFEIDPNGRINEMRECYDRQSIDAQIEAARSGATER
jgi:limonene-1,2-epoxide hydrolase